MLWNRTQDQSYHGYRILKRNCNVVCYRKQDRLDVFIRYINTIGHYNGVRNFGDKRIKRKEKFILKDDRTVSHCEKSGTLN